MWNNFGRVFLLPLLTLWFSWQFEHTSAFMRIRLEDYGGVGDNQTDNTRAFRRALQDIQASGGGSLSLGPHGIFATLPFNLTSHMSLILFQNTTIVARGCEEEIEHNCTCKAWPQLQPLANYGLDHDIGAPSRYQSLVYVQDFVNVSIIGHGSTSVIDGSGRFWWEAHLQRRLAIGRPHLIEALRGSQFVVRDCVLKDSPFWTLHPVAVNGVRVSRIEVKTPLERAPNTDGVDPDACRDVIIRDSTIQTNDDCIAIKAGLNCFGKVYGPCEGVIIQNVTCVNAIVIGSEMSGGVSNVTILNSTGRLYYKTGEKRGGYITDIDAQNIVVPQDKRLPMQKYGLRITTSYGFKPSRCGASWNPQPTNIKGLSFSGIWGAPGLGILNWSVNIDASHANITDLTIANIRLPTARSGVGFLCETAANTVIHGTAFNDIPRACPQLSES